MQHCIQWGTSNFFGCMGTSYCLGPYSYLHSTSSILSHPLQLLQHNKRVPWPWLPPPSSSSSASSPPFSFPPFAALQTSEDKLLIIQAFFHCIRSISTPQCILSSQHTLLIYWSFAQVEMASGETTRGELIGSMAPICTYNECRGCRFKCSAEQIPVDASDPMNSAYHYRCVCHRWSWQARQTEITSFAATSIVQLIQTPAVLVTSFM